MPNQTTVDKFILPDGGALEISTDDGSSWYDLGTLAAGSQFTYNYDKDVIESGNNGKPISRAKNETVALAPSALWSNDLEVWEKFAGGGFNYTAVAGTPVAGATQTIASGSWSYKKFILVENQNAAATIITINSVTLGTDGAIVADTDYYLGQNEKGEYGIYIIDSATVTTESQSVVIDYDYTPAAGKTITGGTSSYNLTRFWARIRHYTDDALTTYDLEMKIYGNDMDSGFNINFKGANEDGLNEATVSFTGQPDTSLTDGSQLFEYYVADGALTSGS